MIDNGACGQFGLVNPNVRTPHRELQVGVFIVGSVAVDVMDDFMRLEIPAYSQFENKAVFVDVAPAVSGGMGRAETEDVAGLCAPSTLPVGVATVALVMADDETPMIRNETAAAARAGDK